MIPLGYSMEISLIHSNIELIHCKEEAQTVIAILGFCRLILTLTSKNYSQQQTSTAAVVTSLLQIYNRLQLGIHNTT
jgi:hypothetical protein